MIEVGLALLGILAVVVPFFIKWYVKRRSVRDALARTEADELETGMASVDATIQRVQPPMPKS